MAGDQISFVAKTDLLITAFGTCYLKSHKKKHLISVVSQKMRTLARFLIVMTSKVGTISSLRECLFPKYFDEIVKCSKIVAQYNEVSDSYKSPSLVLKLGNSLKQCCDIAELDILKKNDFTNLTSDPKKSVKNLKYMIEKKWSYEISTNASKEIYQRK